MYKIIKYSSICNFQIAENLNVSLKCDINVVFPDQYAKLYVNHTNHA